MAEHEPPADLLSIREFAAICRERCPRSAQGHDDLRCGESYLADNERAYAFCGTHWVTVFGALEDR